jgi:CHASE1-domain containing sensor protein
VWPIVTEECRIGRRIGDLSAALERRFENDRSGLVCTRSSSEPGPFDNPPPRNFRAFADTLARQRSIKRVRIMRIIWRRLSTNRPNRRFFGNHNREQRFSSNQKESTRPSASLKRRLGLAKP